jgi:hypothetical protein
VETERCHVDKDEAMEFVARGTREWRKNVEFSLLKCTWWSDGGVAHTTVWNDILTGALIRSDCARTNLRIQDDASVCEGDACFWQHGASRPSTHCLPVWLPARWSGMLTVRRFVTFLFRPGKY